MNNKIWKALVVLILAVALGLYVVNSPLFTMEKTQVTNAFVDINGDGLLDFVVDASVIINTGQPNFPYQPTNSQP
jgi:hypothetical protein